MSEIKEQVTKALSALALSRMNDPKMAPVPGRGTPSRRIRNLLGAQVG